MLLAKRLERGRFVWPQADSGSNSLLRQLGQRPIASNGGQRPLPFASIRAQHRRL